MEGTKGGVRHNRLRRLKDAVGCGAGCVALSVAPLLLGGCTSEVDSTSAGLGVARQAVEGADCGYSITTSVNGVGKKGFNAKVEVTNVTGATSTGFTVLVNADNAQLVHVAHGSFQVVENGYLLSPLDSIQSSQLDQGQSYQLELKFEGTYTQLAATIISNDGVNCDQEVPKVALKASGDLFTSDGKLTLSADASDNVAVAKVVFTQDDVQIGEATTAPYTLDIPVTSALNGRHRYTATAYDLTGNQAAVTKRVLVAIGNKFFGTATSVASDYTNLLAHFNQISPGNAGKWGSVEATRGQMNWTDLDTAYNFAKTNHIPFKLHTLVWGQQQPAWITSLPPDQQLAEIDQWMAALAERYPNVDLIDVVNEPLHAPPSYAAALGGAGVTGWDWVVKAFEMARAHFPNSELLLNDYSILTQASSTQSYLNIVKVLSDRGLIDGIAEQGHFYERAPEPSVLAANLNAFAATGLPLYISELDLNLADDALQANRMRDVFSVFWSNPSVLGVTHWGYRQGNMWQPDSYLIRTDGSVRPALTWIDCYRAGGTNCPVPVYVPQPRTGDNNGITLEAEQYDNAHALMPAGNVVAYASDGSWLSFNKVVFNDNWNTLSVAYAQGGTQPLNLSIHLGSLNNPPVAMVPLAPTGGWSTMQTVSIPWAPVNATQDVFVRWNGGGANVDKLQFSAPTGTGKNLIVDSDFELGTKDSWWSWGGGTIANTMARAVSGSHALAMTGRTGNSPLVETLTSSVVAGKTYKVSLWASIGGAPSATAHVTTQLQCVGGSTSYGQIGGWSNNKTITDGTWVEFAGDLVVPDCPLANVAIYLEGPAAGVDLYIDHVSVRQQSSANIITNGTFESGTTGWSTWSGGSISATKARAHGGSQSLLISNRTSNAPAATDLTSLVKPGSNYPFNLWVSIGSSDGSSKSMHVTQATTCHGASTTYGWIGSPVTVANGAWAQISGTVAVPNCTLDKLQFYVEGDTGADLYVDDVQVLDNSGAPGNLIPDGTFESGQGAWGGWGYSSLAVVSTSSHSGQQSLKGTMNSGAISRDIKAFVTPGKRYQATAWVSVGNLAAGSGSVNWQTVQNCNTDASDSYPWLAGATVNNGEWKQVTGVVDLTACTAVNKLLLFAGAGGGDLYIDDVTLTLLP